MLLYIPRSPHRLQLNIILKTPLSREIRILPLTVRVQKRHVVPPRPKEILPRIIRVQGLILRPVKNTVPHRNHRHNRNNLINALVPFALHQNLRLNRVHRQLRHSPPQFGQIPVVVQRGERVELLQRPREHFMRRRVHEVEIDQIVDPHALQHQHDPA